MEEGNQKRKLPKAPVAILGLLIAALLVYLFGLPLYPEIKFYFLQKQQAQEINQEQGGQETGGQTLPSAEISAEEEEAEETQGAAAGQTQEVNTLIIPKIGVKIPIIESQDSNWALNRGAWRMPETSTPDKGSNTVIAGHRFKYLPPSNLTFYLLDKLVPGDTFSVIWQEKNYSYQVIEIKVVPPTEISVLDPTEKSVVTLLTCTPVFTQEKRLIVVGELVE